MKKSLVALAALAAVGAASAQSSVTLYGVADANVQNQKGSTSLTSIGSGGLNGSRWGVRGTEDLGGGLKGTFRLESGFNIDTGTMAQGTTAAPAAPIAAGSTAAANFFPLPVASAASANGRLFGRNATVGLEGGFGGVRLGRTQTPIGVLGDESATLGSKTMDLLVVGGMLSVNQVYRTDNAITFDSANFGGLTFQAQYSLGLDGAELANRVGRHAGFNVIYKGGPLSGGIGYIDVRTAAATPAAGSANARALLANLGYNFGAFTLRGVAERDNYSLSGNDPTFYGLEASVPFGAFTASLGIARVKDATGLAATSDNVNLWTLQGLYALSKRTTLYTFYTHVDNAAGSALGFRTPALNQNSRSVQIGVRHFF